MFLEIEGYSGSPPCETTFIINTNKVEAFTIIKTETGVIQLRFICGEDKKSTLMLVRENEVARLKRQLNLLNKSVHGGAVGEEDESR